MSWEPEWNPSTICGFSKWFFGQDQVSIPFEMEKNCRNHTCSWRNGCVPLTKFTSISPVEVSHEPSERYRFPSCPVTTIFQFPHLKRLSFLRFQEFPSNLMGASLCWFITNFPYSYSIPSFLIFRTCCFLSKKSPPFWPPHSQKKSPVSKCFRPAIMAL